MANRCVSPINALPSKMRHSAVRARAIRYGGFAIEAELSCINGLSAWFTIAHVDAIDDHELLMTEGAIGNAKDIAEAIVAALAKPSSPAGVREAAAQIIASRSSTYKARNGRVMGIEDDSGEMMWIVPFDDMAAIEAALSPSTSAAEPVGQIEHDPHDHSREYIPLPGGWEVQTKGAGSTYRLLDKKTGERHAILTGKDWKPLQEFFTRFAHELFAASRDECRKLEARALAAEAALLAVAPYVDSIVCYASTIEEHDGNRVAKLVNEAAAAIRARASLATEKEG